MPQPTPVHQPWELLRAVHGSRIQRVARRKPDFLEEVGRPGICPAGIAWPAVIHTTGATGSGPYPTPSTPWRGGRAAMQPTDTRLFRC